jgi:hypothetical protein
MVARALVFLAVIMFSSGLHAQVQCGSQPKIPGDVEDQIKGDVEGKAQIFTKLLGDVNLKGTVESSKKEVYQKYKDLDKSQIDQYMIWVSCQNIMSDPKLSSSEKSKLWIEIYRELTRKSSAAPVDRSALTAELQVNQRQIEVLDRDIEQNDKTAASLRERIEINLQKIARQNLRLERGEGTSQEREEALGAIGNAKAADEKAKATIDQYDKMKADALARIGQLEQRNREIRRLLDRAGL